MKKSTLGSVIALFAAALLASPAALAGKNNMRASAEEARMNKQGSGKKHGHAVDSEASLKQKLAPHSVMIQSSLMSALEQLRGLQTQLQVAEKPSAEFVEHFRIHERKINDGIQTALTHNGHLQNRAKKIEEMKGEKALNSVDQSLTQLQQTQSRWASQMKKEKNYWQSQTQVSEDLQKLEKQLTSALNETKSFNTEKLDLKLVS